MALFLHFSSYFGNLFKISLFRFEKISHMKALVLKEKHQALEYKDVETPSPKEEEVLVDIKAAALNHRDVWITKGLYPGLKFPCILGSDGAGLLDGKAVIINPSSNWGNNPSFQNKDYKILGLPDDGTFAEKVCVPRNKVYPKPEHLSMEEAAALPLAGLTAYRALFSRGKVKQKDKVLINGVGGGVALFACQFAIATGADVYVTSSQASKIEKAIELGAKGGANYTSPDWVEQFQKNIGGFDLIIDSAGGGGFNNLVKLANFGGRIVLYGATRGIITELNPRIVFWKQLSILGSTMGNDEEFKDMLDFVDLYQMRPVIDEIFDIQDGNVAFEKMDKGLQFGKLVLRIDN